MNVLLHTNQKATSQPAKHPQTLLSTSHVVMVNIT